MARTRFHRVALLLLLPGLAVAAGENGPGEGSGRPEIHWASSFEAALEQAQVEARLVMVDFYTGWCGWCKRLDRDTYADPEIVRRSGQIVCLKVDAEKHRDVARRYGVRAYPSIGFLRPDGSLIELVRGYQPPQRFGQTMDRITDTKADEFVLLQRLKDHPEQAEARYDLSLLLLRRGELQRTLNHLDTLAAALDEVAAERAWDIRLNRGRALVALGRGADGRGDLETCVKKNKGSPRLAEALYFLAEACAEAGKPKDARKWYRKLLQIRAEGWLADRCRERLAHLG